MWQYETVISKRVPWLILSLELETLSDWIIIRDQNGGICHSWTSAVGAALVESWCHVMLARANSGWINISVGGNILMSPSALTFFFLLLCPLRCERKIQTLLALRENQQSNFQVKPWRKIGKRTQLFDVNIRPDWQIFMSHHEAGDGPRRAERWVVGQRE